MNAMGACGRRAFCPVVAGLTSTQIPRSVRCTMTATRMSVDFLAEESS
jgi:hypothetical protein